MRCPVPKASITTPLRSRWRVAAPHRAPARRPWVVRGQLGVVEQLGLDVLQVRAGLVLGVGNDPDVRLPPSTARCNGQASVTSVLLAAPRGPMTLSLVPRIWDVSSSCRSSQRCMPEGGSVKCRGRYLRLHANRPSASSGRALRRRAACMQPFSFRRKCGMMGSNCAAVKPDSSNRSRSLRCDEREATSISESAVEGDGSVMSRCFPCYCFRCRGLRCRCAWCRGSRCRRVHARCCRCRWLAVGRRWRRPVAGCFPVVLRGGLPRSGCRPGTTRRPRVGRG